MDRFDSAFEKHGQTVYPEAPKPDANMDARDLRAQDETRKVGAAEQQLGAAGVPVLRETTATAEPHEQASWGEMARNMPGMLARSTENLIANARRMGAEETRAQALEAGSEQNDVAGYEKSAQFKALQRRADERRKKTLRDAEEVGKHMKQWAEDTKVELDRITPEHMDLLQQGVWSLVQSSPPQLVGLATGILTGNPLIGGAIAGAGGFAMQATQTYGEALDKGASHRTAAMSAGIQGAIELFDFLPISVALKPGSPFVKRLLATAATEGVTEAVQQFLQDAQGMVAYDPDMTVGEMAHNMAVAGIAGTLGGLVLGGVGHAAEVHGERAAERARPAITEDQARSIREQVKALVDSSAVMQPLQAKKEAAAGPFEATHRLEDGTPVRATPRTHEGTGMPVWVDKGGNEYVEPRGEPIQAVPPNATFSSGGVDYDVAVIGPGTQKGTARLADGQQVPVSKLNLDDGAKEILGLLPKEEEGKKAPAKPQAEPKAPSPTPAAVTPTPTKAAAPAATEAEPPPPRGARPSEPAAAAPKVNERDVLDENRGRVSETDFQDLVKKAVAEGGPTAYVHLAYDEHGQIAAIGPLEQMPSEVQGKIARKELRRATLRVKPGTTRVLAINYYTARPKEEAENRLEKSLIGRRLNPEPTPAEQKARTEGAKRFKQATKERQKVDVERDTLIPAIIKLGGISKREQLDTVGDTSGKSNPNIPGVGYLFSPRGQGLDVISVALKKSGYIVDESDINELMSMIKAEIGGFEKYYSGYRSLEAQEADARAEQAPEEEPEGPAPEAIEEAARGAPVELDVLPEDFEGDPVGSEPEANAIADLLGQLSEDDAERLSMEYAQASPVEFIDALKKRIAEVTRGKDETLRPGRDSGDTEGGRREARKVEQPPGEYKGKPPESGPAVRAVGETEGAAKPVHEEAGQKARDRLTGEAVTGLLARTVEMSPQEKQEVREWIDREMLQDEKAGEEIANECLGKGERFGI